MILTGEIGLYRNHGCNQLQCILCKHNPNKRCMGNFAHKYWVGDKLLAKCEGEIQVELIDENGKRYLGDLTKIRLEVSIPSPPVVDCGQG
jgi:hypothetical protein